MTTTQTFSADELAAAGRALYGERWQAQLAQDLNVGDRTLRRWLAEDLPVPPGIEREVRRLLTERLESIGGLLRYSVNPMDCSILHHPTGAYFRYDENGHLTLMNGWMVAKEQIDLIRGGAQEALRLERARDPRIKVMWQSA